MLNLCDTLLAIDHQKCVSLYLTPEGRPYLLHRHTSLGRCFLPSIHLGYALQHIKQSGANDLAMHLELRPAIPGLSSKLPFIAFIGLGQKVVLAYAPAKLTTAEAEPIFETFTDLPVLICDAGEFFVGDQTWLRIVEAERLTDLEKDGSPNCSKTVGGASFQSQAHIRIRPAEPSEKNPALNRRIAP